MQSTFHMKMSLIYMKMNLFCTNSLPRNSFWHNPGGGGTFYNGLHGEAPPERGTFFRLQVYKRVGISQVEVYKRVGKSVI